MDYIDDEANRRAKKPKVVRESLETRLNKAEGKQKVPLKKSKLQKHGQRKGTASVRTTTVFSSHKSRTQANLIADLQELEDINTGPNGKSSNTDAQHYNETEDANENKGIRSRTSSNRVSTRAKVSDEASTTSLKTHFSLISNAGVQQNGDDDIGKLLVAEPKQNDVSFNTATAARESSHASWPAAERRNDKLNDKDDSSGMQSKMAETIKDATEMKEHTSKRMQSKKAKLVKAATEMRERASELQAKVRAAHGYLIGPQFDGQEVKTILAGDRKKLLRIARTMREIISGAFSTLDNMHSDIMQSIDKAVDGVNLLTKSLELLSNQWQQTRTQQDRFRAKVAIIDTTKFKCHTELLKMMEIMTFLQEDLGEAQNHLVQAVAGLR